MTDYLRKYKSLFSTTLASGIGTGTGDTLTLSSVTGLPTDTPITITVDRVDSEGNTTPTKLERITGTISGSNLTSYTRGVDGTTEQAHSAGAVIEMIFNAEDWNDVVDWGLVEHNQDGTHKAATVTTLKATGAEINTGTEDAKIVTPKALADSNFKQNPMTAAGDIIYGGANGAPTRLAKGTAAQVLTMNSGATAPEWAAGNTDGWTAGTGTWAYATADDPTFTLTVNADVTGSIGVGDRIKLTQTTAKYFIVTAISYSAPNTTITVYGGTDYDLANEAITTPFYSHHKSPLGFPMSPLKWSVETNSTSIFTPATPSVNTWYNGHNLVVPIGAWNLGYWVIVQVVYGSASSTEVWSALSTANNSASDKDLVAVTIANTQVYAGDLHTRTKYVALAAKTTYYLNAKYTTTASATVLHFRGDYGSTIIRAVCAYL